MAWPKMAGIFLNVLPNFETIVSSIQRKIGCNFRFSGIRFKATEAVGFIKIKGGFLHNAKAIPTTRIAGGFRL